MSILPSGEQWTIRHGDHEAVVVEVGGGLRTYAFRGRDVLAGYPGDAQCSAGRGQLLMPWPNRIRDGRYSFSGQSHQLATALDTAFTKLAAGLDVAGGSPSPTRAPAAR